MRCASLSRHGSKLEAFLSLTRLKAYMLMDQRQNLGRRQGKGGKETEVSKSRFPDRDYRLALIDEQ